MRYLSFFAVILAGCSTQASTPEALLIPESRPESRQSTGLQPCDRVVIFGASNVKRGTELDTGFVRLISAEVLRRHMQMGIQVFGSGVNRNTLQQLQERLDDDVLSLHPTLVVIDCGVNDVREPQPAKGMTSTARYSGPAMPIAMRAKFGMASLVSRIKAMGASVVLCTPGIIEPGKSEPGNFDKQLDEVSDAYREIAKEQSVKIVELRKEFQARQKRDPKQQFTIDGVHWNDAGNQVVAETILATIDP